jgi:CubicO group peptidase (beta-lactamase class C family)
MSAFLDNLVHEVRLRQLPIYQIAEITDQGSSCVEITPGNLAHACYSIAKSFTSLGLGLLADQGLLSVHDPIYPLLAEFFPPHYDPKWEKVTVEDVIQHKVGLAKGMDFDLEDLFHDPVLQTEKGDFPDFLTFLFSQKIEKEIGVDFVYSDINFYIISRIISKLSGEDTEKFLMKRVFLPLGFHNFAWSRCPLGYTLGGSGFFCQTNDLAKLGKLYLDRGVWNGQAIFSDKWADYVLGFRDDGLATSLSVASRDGDFYHISGYHGQHIFFHLKTRRVIACHSYGESDFESLYRTLEEKAVQELSHPSIHS